MNDFWPVVLWKKIFLRIDQKFHKNPHNSMENRGGTQILTNLVEVNPRNINAKFEANLYSGLREVKNVVLHSDI